MKKLILIILIVLSPTLITAQWEPIGDYLNGKEKFDYLGAYLSMSGDGNTIALSTIPLNEENNVKVYKYSNNQWNQVGEDILLDDQGRYYSYKPSLDENGTTLAIRNKVYQLISDNWIQLGKDLEGKELDTCLGAVVKLSSNGKVIAIESKCSKEDTTSYGFLKVFELIGNEWVQRGDKIVSENPGPSYGDLLELSYDGRIVTFGIPLGVIDGNSQSRIKVYEYSNNSWIQLGHDINGIINSYNNVATLDLNADGTTLIIGEPGSTVGKKVEFTGDVNVYKYFSEDWYQIGQNIYGELSYLGVGSSTSISADGTIIAISTPNYSKNFAPIGKVDMYKLTANRWEQLGSSIEGENREDFGYSLDLSSDGFTVLIGAPGNDSIEYNSGQVRVFRYNPATSVYESADDESVSVYPNPTKGEVNIQIIDQTLLSEISIVDETGKQVYIKEIAEQTSNIDISNLTAGVYYIHIENSNGTTIKKIIKE